jgi:hypothetical protein
MNAMMFDPRHVDCVAPAIGVTMAAHCGGTIGLQLASDQLGWVGYRPRKSVEFPADEGHQRDVQIQRES